jgi:hypothetical protein
MSSIFVGSLLTLTTTDGQSKSVHNGKFQIAYYVLLGASTVPFLRIGLASVRSMAILGFSIAKRQ